MGLDVPLLRLGLPDRFIDHGEQGQLLSDLRRIPETILLSRRTHAVLWQNIGLALGIKAIFLGLAIFGNATMWMAVFADMGASLLVVFNGLRLLKAKTA